MRRTAVLALIAALQLISFTQGFSFDNSNSREIEESEAGAYRSPPRPLRKLRETVAGIISNFRPTTTSHGFSSQSGHGSSAPCSSQQGCGNLVIPVATGGVNPPAGYVPAQDLFILENFPPMMPAHLNPSFGAFGPAQNSPVGSFGSSSSASVGSSQSSPGFSTSFGTPSRPSSGQNGQGSFTSSSLQPVNHQPPQIPSSNNQNTNFALPSFSGDGTDAGPQVQATSVPPPPPPSQSIGKVESAIVDVVNGIKDFTLDLLSTFRALGGAKNIVFSPVSIAGLLSLLNLGTKGLSKQEIEIALNLPDSRSGINAHEIYQQIMNGANYQSEGVNITTSARIFMDQKIRVKQPFIEDAHRYYNCSVALENFVSRPSQARRRINQWVKDQTYGKITNFISSPLPSTTRMVVANTIYFSGSWKTPFPEFVTADRDFNTGRKTIKVPMMTNVLEAPHYFSKVLNVDVVALPYTGGKYAMIIILPKEEPNQRSIKQLETELDSFYIEELLKNMTVKQVSVSLPRMKLSMKMQLKSNLEQLRISSIFQSFSSDFSGISDDKPLFVNQMLHEAVMEITEKGTVAAAASGVMLDRIGGFPRIVVNKPAILYIADYVNALPLFWARVVEPVPINN